MGLLDDRKKTQYLQMAEEKLQGLLNLPQQAQRFMTNPTAFLGLLGQNPLPRESGFAAGATGLPPTEMSVLDPNQAPYMQGYGHGEPVGYAGMALPFAAPAAVATGRALAPKAGQAIESYMVNQGLLQPLTAYHGTPHNIQGKFDINKVGTGEGAQAYGHGMYFAEAPDVAKTYMTVGGKGEFVRIGDKVVPTASLEGQLLSDVTKLGRKAAINKYPDQADYIKTINPDNIQFEGGNLYKVDIPDKDIPNMLDFDKPYSAQPDKIKAIFGEVDKNNRISTQLAYERWMANNNLTPPEASKVLAEQGIPGIRYLDEGSRGNYRAQTTYKGEPYSDMLSFKTKGQLDNFIKEKEAEGFGVKTFPQTSNFVVFEPSTVKILEKNKKKVGLLD